MILELAALVLLGLLRESQLMKCRSSPLRLSTVWYSMNHHDYRSCRTRHP